MDAQTDATIDRRALLEELFPTPERYILIAGLAGAARDVAGYTREAENVLTLGGAMGGAVPMGLGVALSAPDERVAVVTGDGELLMNVGALATVASAQPENLTIVCLDNGAHGETGGQAGHTSVRTDLAVMAQGAGVPSVMSVTDAADFEAARSFIEDAPGPRFLCVRIMAGPPTAYTRNWDLAECRLRFRNAYLAKRDGR